VPLGVQATTVGFELTGWPTCAGPETGTVTFDPSDLYRPLDADCAPVPSQLPLVVAARTCESRPLKCDDSADEWAEVWCRVELARCEARTPLNASAAWRKAADRIELTGHLSVAAMAQRNAAFAALSSRAFVEASARLDDARRLDAQVGSDEGPARTAYYDGCLSQELGDTRRAVVLLQTARDGLLRIGNAKEACRISIALAAAQAQSGQWPEVVSLLPELETPTCAQNRSAEREGSVAWLHFLAARAGAIPQDWPSIRARLERARDLALSTDSQTTATPATYTNLASFEHHVGQLDAAEAALRAFDQLPGADRTFGAVEALLVNGDVALARGDTRRATRVFDRALERAREEAAGLDADPVWRALYGQARVLRARGRVDEAVKRFHTALEVQARAGLRTLVRAGRATYYDDRRGVVNDLLALLVERGRLAEAFAVNDAVGGRVLRTLESGLRAERLSPEARRTWLERVGVYLKARQAYEDDASTATRLSGKKLAAWRAARREAERAVGVHFEAAYDLLDREAPSTLPEGATLEAVQARLGERHALLAFMPLQQGTQALWVTRTRLQSVPVDPQAPLTALEPLLSGLDRLTVVPGELIAAFSLPEAGSPPLATRLEVEFAPYAGLWARAAPRSNGAGGVDVVVADPENNLPAARAEGRQLVDGSLKGATLLVGDAADRTSVLDALASARLFHFAGHGELAPDQPWDARVRLAGEQSLTLSDLFLVPHRAELVVLNGCSTGKRLAMGRHERVGLPEAFLVAGAHAVLATGDDVDDTAARRFITRFYAAGPQSDPGTAYRRATEAAHREGDVSWREFRLFATAR
jgi:tetratricopeptide (TPR) repeat protein